MKKITICVIGRYDEKKRKPLETCRSLGRLIGQSGAVLITGGGGGIMEMASRGAKEAGGITLGFLPESVVDVTENDYLDIVIPTGTGYEIRSALAIRASDIVIMIGGGNGTLGELSIAYLNHKPIFILRGSSGWADRLPSVLIKGKYLDERRNTLITFVDTPEECMQCISHLPQVAQLKSRESKKI